MNRSLFRQGLVVALCAGCAAPSDVAQQTQLVGGDGGCPVWGCGSNSPVIDAITFHDVNEIGYYNVAHFRVVRFEKYWAGAWRQYRPDVVRSELVARNLLTGAIVHKGDAITGARFEMYNADSDTYYYLVVGDTKPIPMWAHGPNAPAFIPTYHLLWTYKDAPKVEHDVCGESDDNDGMAPFHALLFEGDRIDARSITVTGQSRDWFNIGCKGHALGKQHLTGHSMSADAILGIQTTFDQRTANLKMITADYCGNGHPFTQPHVPLHWKDEFGWYGDVDEQKDALEARWTANGAACLQTPRVVAHVPDPYLLGDDVEALIAAACKRPDACTDTSLAMDGVHVLSATPP